MPVGKSSIARAASAKQATDREVMQELTATAPAPAAPKKRAAKPVSLEKAPAKPGKKSGSTIYSLGQELPVYLL